MTGPEKVRLSLDPALTCRGAVGGAWWPATYDAGAELPALIAAIDQRLNRRVLRVGPAHRHLGQHPAPHRRPRPSRQSGLVPHHRPPRGQPDHPGYRAPQPARHPTRHHSRRRSQGAGHDHPMPGRFQGPYPPRRHPRRRPERSRRRHHRAGAEPGRLGQRRRTDPNGQSQQASSPATIATLTRPQWPRWTGGREGSPPTRPGSDVWLVNAITDMAAQRLGKRWAVQSSPARGSDSS
ncbi:hypothetical protein B0I32_121149 [Nonomuraea fuscirosea]|uniref:Uncharacterized protein n=1 Tax=Nonomuraea fuscirosea TaxID=1291556 RepID=A0A2T0MMJ9_9ACTN|nr:hypothetical protein B0I32_121149 [Nonomuraea fuscirosea]